MIFCREKGEEELKAKTELRKKEELARRRTKELKEATEWYELCLKREKIRNNLARKITESTKTIDTQTINGFHQRFATENLRKRLYEDYFRTIAFSIANKAETISAERKIFFIQEKLSINKRVLTERITSMKTLWKDIQRDDLMRIRKSILNEKLFPKHRHNVLKQRFGSWFLTHSLTHSLTYSLTHSLTHSLTGLLTYSLTHSLTHLLTYSLTHVLTHLFTGSAFSIGTVASARLMSSNTRF